MRMTPHGRACRHRWALYEPCQNLVILRATMPGKRFVAFISNDGLTDDTACAGHQKDTATILCAPEGVSTRHSLFSSLSRRRAMFAASRYPPEAICDGVVNRHPTAMVPGLVSGTHGDERRGSITIDDTPAMSHPDAETNLCLNRRNARGVRPRPPGGSLPTRRSDGPQAWPCASQAGDAGLSRTSPLTLGGVRVAPLLALPFPVRLQPLLTLR